MKRLSVLFLTASLVAGSVQAPVLANEIDTIDTDEVLVTEAVEVEEEVLEDYDLAVEEENLEEESDLISVEETVISLEDEAEGPVDSQGSIQVGDINAIEDESAEITMMLPADFEAAYEVDIEGAEIDAEARTISVPASTVPGTYTVTAKDQSGKYLDVSCQFTVSNYILVNIPYAQFYKADVRNDVEVDAFSSATKSKPAMANLAGNTYHKADNSEITGVTFPVLTDSVEDFAAVESEDALLTAESMSYAAVLTEKPVAFKVYENGVFGALQGQVNTVSDVSVSMKTSSGYGDYQIDIEGLLTSTDRSGNVTAEGVLSKDAKVYGVIVSTADNDYGMRALENIWRSELAWCTGFTSIVHNCPTSSAHYVSMMGQTITSITYITNEGIVKADGLNIYVQKKSADTSVQIANAYLSEGAAVITATFAEGFDPEYVVNGIEGAAVADGKVNFPETTAPGQYSVTVSDKSGVYADVSANFQVVSDILPATYDASKKALVASADASAEQFEEYINKITAVAVDGVNYNKMGMRDQAGTVIVKTDEDSFGQIDTSLSLFAEEKAYQVSISVVGYDTLEFVVNLAKPADKTALQAKYDEASKLTESAYTAASYAALKTELGKASDLLAKEDASQEEVDDEIGLLTAAVNALVKMKSQTVTTSAASYKKTYGNKEFSLGAKASGKGALSYKSSNTKVVTVSSKGLVTIKGAGTAKITVKAAATAEYKAASKTVTITVAKAAQPMKLKVSAKSYTASALNKKAATFSIGASKAVGKVTYKSSSKSVTVTSKGVVTVKKGTKKGTYKVTVTAAGTTNYAAGSKVVKITVK